MNSEITKYQRRCWMTYKQDLGLDDNYTYLYGNPIKVHVPVDTATNGLMIIGAYPTAHFQTIKSIPDVPVEDHLYPFSTEKYFDGSSIRTVKSGEELEEYYLKDLGIKRGQCWITDLVKVFLFKKGHTDRYLKLGFNNFSPNRHKFKDYANCSLPFIEDEIKLANPKVILTLGAEVTSVIHQCSLEKATAMIKPEAIQRTVHNKKYNFFAVPHPGILMRNTEGSEKWRGILKDQIIPVIRRFL